MSNRVKQKEKEKFVKTREALHFNIVIIGGGPAGLAAAIKAKQKAAEAGKDVSVVILEKGAEIGSHLISGAVLDPSSLLELIPEEERGALPLDTPVTEEKFYLLGEGGDIALPQCLLPPFMKNHGNYVISIGALCKALAAYAEKLGVDLYPGMAACEPLFTEKSGLRGVVAGVFGLDKDGNQKADYEPGAEILGDYILIAEGAHGSLAKRLIRHYRLNLHTQRQKFGLGIKEVWEIPASQHKKGFIAHSVGYPLKDKAGGGGFMYHYGDNLVSVGLVTHLDYENPTLSPFEEFQALKTHPLFAETLKNGKRLSYGARAVTEGGLQSIPKLVFPGGALIGCSAGLVNLPKIKGVHNAIKSGALAGEAAVNAVAEGGKGDLLREYCQTFKESAIYKELTLVRNVKPLWSRLGLAGGVVAAGFDMWMNYVTGGFSLFGTLRHEKADHESLKPLEEIEPITYPKPDNVLTFDRLSSLALSGVNHAENQPVHLHLKDPTVPIRHNLPLFGEPAQYYCPAGVYEITRENGAPKFQINAQNCVHCKTCDIKDPAQNILWQTPEGGGGPNYAGV